METAEKLITEKLDVWTSAVKAKSSAGRGAGKKRELYGIQKLRELIMHLAARGLLVPQDPHDEPASELLKRIGAQKAQLVKEKIIKQQKTLPAISEDELPFSIPDTWSFIRLPESYYLISPGKKKLKSSEINEAGKHPVIDQGAKHISGYHNDSSLLTRIPNPVIVFGDHTRNIKFVDHDFIAGADGTKILCPYVIDPRFFYTYLRHFNLEKKGYARHFKILNSNLIAIPPFAEQHRIVAKVDELMALCDQLEQEQESSLDTHDTLVATLLGALTEATASAEAFAQAWQRIQANFDTLFTTESSIDQLKQTILQLAVMGKLVPQNPDDEPAAKSVVKVRRELEDALEVKKIKKGQLPLPTKQKDTEAIPHGWTHTTLPEVVRAIPHSIKRGPFGSSIKKDMFVPQGYKVYEQQHAIYGDFEVGNYYLSESDFKKLEAFELKPGDVVISCSGTVGRVSVVPSGIEPGVINQALLKLSLHQDALLNNYFQMLFPTYFMELDSLSDLKGTAQKNMPGMPVMKSLVFPLPPL
ncbi:restriction endonuclease subunit S, partial [Verrucomicrobia bacterium]|nr:restriction endonuclease subunit S [Verrucomicrobiota bacterium]